MLEPVRFIKKEISGLPDRDPIYSPTFPPASRYAAMRRLLREDEIDFVRGHIPVSRMRRQRAQIFRHYLKSLQREMRSVQEANRIDRDQQGAFDFGEIGKRQLLSAMLLFRLRTALWMYQFHLTGANAMVQRTLVDISSHRLLTPAHAMRTS